MPEWLSTSIDLFPLAGSVKGGIEGIIGYDAAGNKLSPGDRALGVVPYAGKFKKILKVVNAADKFNDTKKLTKAANKVDDAVSTEKGIVKNSEAISEGKKFEADELANSISEGKNATGRNRLVPKNGKGNVKGNRTDTDQLIKNDDGTFSIIETKRSANTKQSKGQKAAESHTNNGNGIFEIRNNQPSQGLSKGDRIEVKNYTRKNKHG